jgi:hypothetical protein
VNVVVAVLLTPIAGVALYSHVGGSGGADGGWQLPSQSTMYSTYTRLPSYQSPFTVGVAAVTKVYVPSALGGSGACLAHSKKPRPSTTAPSDGLHLPCST